jgi:hypothetical protein
MGSIAHNPSWVQLLVEDLPVGFPRLSVWHEGKMPTEPDSDAGYNIVNEDRTLNECKKDTHSSFSITIRGLRQDACHGDDKMAETQSRTGLSTSRTSFPVARERS